RQEHDIHVLACLGRELLGRLREVVLTDAAPRAHDIGDDLDVHRRKTLTVEATPDAPKRCRRTLRSLIAPRNRLVCCTDATPYGQRAFAKRRSRYTRGSLYPLRGATCARSKSACDGEDSFVPEIRTCSAVKSVAGSTKAL